MESCQADGATDLSVQIPWMRSNKKVRDLMRKALIILAMVGTTANTSAGAFCSEPSFSGSPTDAPGTFEEPDVPYCLQDYRWSGRHSCEDYEIDAYQNDVDEFLRKLNSYTNEVVSFANEASNFSEASSYARCKSDEVAGQLR